MYHQGDRIIWELCLKGDRNAFEALYRKYYPILYNYGKLYTQDADIVKNCLQDFFLILENFRLCLIQRTLEELPDFEVMTWQLCRMLRSALNCFQVTRFCVQK